MLLNPSNGLINGLFVKVLGLEKGPFNIYSMAGLIFVEALILDTAGFPNHRRRVEKHGSFTGGVRQDARLR